MTLRDYKKTLTKRHKPRTVIFLIKDEQVLLGFKKSGFGKNLYVGIGGKVEKGEAIEKAAVRELAEEIGVKVQVGDLEKVAILNFYFPHISDESWNQQVHAYIVNSWIGEIIETDEIKPVWFDKSKMPLEKMWDDAKYWIPQVLNGERSEMEFMYDKNLKAKEQKIIKKSF